MILRALLLLLLAVVHEAAAASGVQLSESFGGPHGTAFSDEASCVSGQTVSSITIRAGKRVDGINLEPPQQRSHTVENVAPKIHSSLVQASTLHRWRLTGKRRRRG